MKKQMLGSLVAVALLGWAGSASAGLVPTFLSETTTATTSTFNYSVNFTSNGSTETLTSGDFFTLYDVGSLQSAAVGGSFSLTQQLLGTSAPFTAPPDSASILNVTESYTGSSVTADTTFTYSVTFAGVLATANGYYSSTDTISLGKNSQAGRVTVPLVVVPEPTTCAALALGAMVSAGAFLRRRSAKI